MIWKAIRSYAALSALVGIVSHPMQALAAADEYGEKGVIVGAEFNGGDGSYKKAVSDGIVIGICAEFPWTYQDEKTGEYAGLDVAILKEAARRVGITKVSFSMMTFSDLVPSLQAKRIDVAGENIHVNPDRAKVIQFTSPAYFYGGVVAVPKGNPANITTWESLSGKAVGVTRGTFFHDAVSTRKDLGRLEAYPNPAVEFGDLSAGRIDAIVEDDTKVFETIKKNPGLKIEVTNVALPNSLQLGYARYGLRKDDVDLNWALSRAIDEMRADGTLIGYLAPAGLPKRNMFNYSLQE